MKLVDDCDEKKMRERDEKENLISQTLLPQPLYASDSVSHMLVASLGRREEDVKEGGKKEGERGIESKSEESSCITRSSPASLSHLASLSLSLSPVHRLHCFTAQEEKT